MERFEEGSGSIWKDILTVLNCAVFVLDSRGGILFANEAAQSAMGFSPATLRGKSFRDLLTPEDHACYFPNLLYLAAKGKPFDGEIMLVRQSGARFVAFMTVSPHIDPQSGERFIIVCIPDAGLRENFPERGFARDHY